MNQEHRNHYVFGEFRLDEAERQLLLNGVPVALSPKIFDTLLLLVQNAGHLVEKGEFMRQLWPGTFVGEDALARNVSILRKVLGESSDSQSVITTVPTRGYRFTAPVQRVSPVHEQESHAGEESEQTLGEQMRGSGSFAPGIASTPAQEVVDTRKAEPQSWWSRRITLVVLGLAVGSFAGAITFYLLLPAPVPTVIHTEQITHTGRVDPWGRVVTDGSRIYYLERQGDHWDLMETSVSGGDSHPISAPFRNTLVMDISPDGSQFLIGKFTQRGTSMPIWIWPVQGGALKRVGQIETTSAAWKPDGRQIVYSKHDGIYIADVDGTDAHRLVRTDGMPGAFSWAPDGHILRFVLFSVLGDMESRALWEVRADGTGLRPLLPGWTSLPVEGPGTWSLDGKYFIFHSYRPPDIWALREHSFFLPSRHDQPTRLAAGALGYWGPVFGKNGHKLFVVGVKGGGAELALYDLKSHQASSFLSGACLLSASFSPDGTRLGCLSVSGQSLVRMRPDGSDRLVFTPASLFAGKFAWSPDGTQIVFEGVNKEWRQRLYLVSADGGEPKEAFPDNRLQLDPAWSPDGKYLAFVRQTSDSSVAAEPQFNIQVLDLSSKQLSVLPGSLGIRSPAWSPDGQLIAGVAVDGHKLLLFDLRTQQSTQLSEGALIYGSPYWSKDSESIYFQDILSEGEAVYRFRLSTHKKERLASFEDLLRSGIQRVALEGFSPHDALILTVDRNIADVYSLEVSLP